MEPPGSEAVYLAILVGGKLSMAFQVCDWPRWGTIRMLDMTQACSVALTFLPLL